MKISKLLKMMLGLSGWLNLSIVDGEGGGGGTLDTNSAAEAFSSLLGDDGSKENDSQDDDSPEAAAERLAKQDLSGVTDPNPGEGDPAPVPEDITVEIDGKTVKLTKAQIAENYKDGLRQADYTRKTMETAEARKAADAETNKARTERDAYAHKLNNFAISTDASMQQLAAELTQDLLVSDPVEYLTKERILKEGHAKLVQARQELGYIEQQQQQERAEANRNYLSEQHAQLLAKLPDWKDPVKAKAESSAIRDYLGTQGFAPQECDFNDHRAVVMAKKAMQYDALIERANKAVKKVAALPAKVERSGSPEVSKPDGRTESMKRLGRTGSIDDAAAAFSQMK